MIGRWLAATRRRRGVTLGLIVGSLLPVTQGDLEPQWIYVIVGPMLILGPLLTGYWGGLRGAATFACAYASTNGVRLALVDTEDSCVTGVCDTWDNGILYILIPELLLVAVGAGAARLMSRRSRSKRNARTGREASPEAVPARSRQYID